MNDILVELIIRKQKKEKIVAITNQVITVDKTIVKGLHKPNKISKQEVHHAILQACDMSWSPKNAMLINEVLESLGAICVKSQGYNRYINVSMNKMA